jgi:intracellular septation protein
MSDPTPDKEARDEKPPSEGPGKSSKSGKSEAEPEPADRSKLLVDFGPLVVFFIGYRVSGILTATAAFMVAVTLALGFTWLKTRKLPTMPLVTAVIVLVFGGLTLGLGDPRFIYLKPTIVASLTALVLLGGLAFDRPLLKPVLGTAVQLTHQGWRTLSLRFALFSFVLAGANELVWRTTTPEREHLWVWFKFLGVPGLTLLFLMSQAGVLRRFAVEPSES